MARFPADLIIDADTDFVSFSFLKYKAGEGQFSAGGETSIDRATYSGDGYTKLFESAGIESVYLYMPEDINSQIEASYSGKSMGVVGRSLLKAAGDAVKGDIGGAGSTLAGILSEEKMKGYGTAIAASLAAAGLGQIPGVSSGSITANDLLQGVGSEIFNPNVELFYEGPNLRTFDMSFKMTARNKSDTNAIQKIIEAFRVAAAPSSASSAGNFIKVPPVCDVQFRRGKAYNIYLPRHKYCNITRVDVSYTADGSYSTFTDGSPVSVTLALSFQETKIIFAEDIKGGY